MKRLGLLLMDFMFCLVIYGQNEPYRSDINWVTTPSNTSWLYALSEEAYITVSMPVNEHWISTTTRYSMMEWIKKQLK